MSETTEIRDWAIANGILDEGRRGPLPSAVREAWEQRDTPDDDEPPMVVELPTVPAPEPSPAAATAPLSSPRRPETPPRGKKVSAAERFRQRVTAAPKKKARKRVSIEDTVSALWAGAGFALTRVPSAIPVGRCLIYQSSVAGIIAEDQLKDTMADKLIQPIARAGEQGKVALALAGPPLLVAAMSARPEMEPVLRPMLHMALLTWVQLAGPAVEKAQKKAEAMTQEMGGLDLDALIEAFFSPEGLPVQESPEEEDAIRRARGE